MAMLFLPVLLIAILFHYELPQRNQRGIQAQIIDESLSSVRLAVLEFKARPKDASVVSLLRRNEQSNKQIMSPVLSRIEQIHSISGVESQLSENLDEIGLIYKNWVIVERENVRLLQQANTLQLTEADVKFLSSVQVKRDEHFLEIMTLLSNSEVPLHQTIAHGHDASRVLQLSGYIIIAYLAILLALYQYALNLKLRAREKDLEITLGSIGDAVISVDAKGHVIRINHEAERLTDWYQSEAKGLHLFEVVKLKNNFGDVINNFSSWLSNDQANLSASSLFSLESRYGDRYEIEGKSSLMQDDDGANSGVVFVFRDVTDSLEMQRDIESYSLRLRHIIDNSMAAVVVMDEAGHVSEWGVMAEMMFGWSFLEILEKPLHESIVPREYRQHHINGIQELIKGGQKDKKIKRMETVALHKEGYEFPIELSIKPVCTESGWVFYAYIRDLTNEAKKDKSIVKNEALLLAAQDVAKLGCWEFDHVAQTLEWSEETYKIFGYDSDEFQPSYDSFLAVIHKDDRENVKAEFARSISEQSGYDIIHRIMLGDGSKKIVHERCTTTFHEDGSPLRSLGVVQDITEHTTMLDELRLAETAFSTHAGILITEKDGTIIRVNPAIEKMTGYSAEELIGQNPRIFQSGVQDKKFYADMWELISEVGVWQGEVWNKRKDGELYAEWLTITSVNNEYGEVVRYVATSQDITKRKQAEAHIEHLAYHDDLTGLANRRLLLAHLEKMIASCVRHENVSALLLLDLDHFKDLNDSLGHPIGDELLRQVAARLIGMVREEDIVARLGGDEFVILLSNMGHDELVVGFEVQRIVDKIRQCLSEHYNLSGNRCYINVSVGVILVSENTQNVDDVFKHADSALYNAKEKGRNTVSFYEPSMQAEVDRRLSISEGLREALNNNQFVLHYQPQLDSNNRLSGAEALIRWNHPENGLIPPNDFISVAEETGLIIEVGNWVIQEAVQQIGVWHKAGLCKKNILRLAINVSPQQFHQENFVEQVLDILKKAEVSPDCIELEITESLLMQNCDEVIDKIKRLRANHIRIAIDDFGTGYSSLAYLKQLPLDQLKIDQSFVRDIVENGSDAMIVETIISIAAHMDLEVIAEGVETKAQLDFLIDKGCQNFQGYYFSRPLKADDFEKYVIELM